MSTRFIRICAGLLVLAALAGAQTKSSDDPPWRAKFDEAYGLAKGQALRHVPPPLIPERLDFYKWAAKAQAEAVPEGPASMTVRWAGGNPRFGGARFGGGGEGMRLRDVLESVVGLKPHEFDGPRELLDLELPGDWAIRFGAKPPALLDGLAARLREITARELSFARERAALEVIVARGTPKPPDDLPQGETWALDLGANEIEFLRPFGAAGPLDHLFNTVARSTGWPVIDETTAPAERQPFVSWSGARVTEDESLQRIERAQLDLLIGAIAKQTGLELTVERRDLERWKLVEKE